MTPPKLKDDCFALPAGVNWVPVDDALARLRVATPCIAATLILPTEAAGGHVLAAPVTARRANPPYANSAVDGYGFAHAALGSDADHLLPLVSARAAAGAPFEGQVPAGSAIRILTGAVLPQGVDTVIMQEDVTVTPSAISFGKGLKARTNTRKAGEDVQAGDTALPAGHRLRPQDLGFLAALGVTEVSVYRPLRVAVLSTGDEIVPLGTDAAPHQVYDANRPMLIEMIRRWGMEPVDLGHVGDDPQALRGALDQGAARADAILTTGGASAGDEDHLAAVVQSGGTLTTWRIAVKPGRPLALGLWQGVPIFGLPGNPVAAFVCTVIFARPALGQMGGIGWRAPQALTLSAGFAKSKKAGRREYLRARLNAGGRVEVFGSEGSGRISGLSWAEGLVELPDEAMTVSPGDPVRYLPFSAFDL